MLLYIYFTRKWKLYSRNRFYFLHCSYFHKQIFCINVVLRLDLVHSKYAGNRKKIQRWKKIQHKRRSLKTILSDLSCSKHFWKTHRKNPIDFTSASSSKREPLHRWFLVNFPNRFKKNFFYKTLPTNWFCISLWLKCVEL